MLPTPITSDENLEVARVAVRLLPFILNEPELWFCMMKRSFTASGITTEETKFSYVVGALEAKYTIEVKDIIINPPSSFTRLRDELIKRLSSSQEEKTRRLLEREEMGDRKPSQFLRYLRDLTGFTVSDGDLRPLWLGRLPANAQAIRTTQKDTPLDKVAELAYAVVEVNTGATSQVAETQTSSSVEALINVKMAQPCSHPAAGDHCAPTVGKHRVNDTATVAALPRAPAPSLSLTRTTESWGGLLVSLALRGKRQAVQTPCSYQENDAGNR